MSDGQEYTVESARAAAERDELNRWVGEFLASPGSDNAELGAELTDPPRPWLGPVALPISSLHRLAGPSDEPVLVEWDEEDWPDYVEDMADRVRDEGWTPPPVIASWQRGQLVLEDGNHRVEALRRAGIEEAWTVVAFASPEERDAWSPPEAA